MSKEKEYLSEKKIYISYLLSVYLLKFFKLNVDNKNVSKKFSP